MPSRREARETATYMERSPWAVRAIKISCCAPFGLEFHAGFSATTGQWRVADAGSKNGTRINQDESSKRELTNVNPGDIVRFGSVETIVCAPDMLWKVAQWT